MPQFYQNDNIQCWMRSLIVESYESIADDDEKLEYAKRITNYDGIRAEADNLIEMMVDTRCNSEFVTAIMNTIDWKELLDDVAKDIDWEEEVIEAT